MCGIGCLIIGCVTFVGRSLARDVGRQRHLAFARDGFVQCSSGLRERDLDFTRFAARNDVAGEFAEYHSIAGRKTLGGTRETDEAIRRCALVQEEFELGALAHFARCAFAAQTSRDHLGVVDDEHVASAQEVRQIADVGVFELSISAHDQHPRGIAWGCRA